MEFLVPHPNMVTFWSLIAIMVLFTPVYGQVSTPCNASVIASFTPCMNFVTNSSTNGTAPTSDCCSALKSLTSSSMDCLCLIVTGNVPLQLPINRTLAVSLPRACNMPGVPLQCKASGAPIAAPAPDSLVPTLSPGVSPAASPKAVSSVPESTSPAATPESDSTPPSLPTGGSEAPTGSRQALNPSAAMPSSDLSPSILLFASAFLFIKFY